VQRSEPAGVYEIRGINYVKRLGRKSTFRGHEPYQSYSFTLLQLDAMQRGLYRHKLSARSSVTRRYYIETVMHVLKLFFTVL